jgi:hypothetical protein
MIPQGVQVFVALEAIDLRYSFDRNPLTRDVGPRACAEGELMAGG